MTQMWIEEPATAYWATKEPRVRPCEYVYSNADLAFICQIVSVVDAPTWWSEDSPTVFFLGSMGTGSACRSLSDAVEMVTIHAYDIASVAPSSPIAEMVASIRSTLSLRMTEMASILNVERPTVYSWLKGETTPNASNLDRLRVVWGIGQWWQGIADEPVGVAIRQPIPPEGRRIVDALASVPLQPELVKPLMRQLVDASHSEQGFKRPGEFARDRGYDIGTEMDQEHRLSAETGKRSGPEE